MSASRVRSFTSLTPFLRFVHLPSLIGGGLPIA